MSKNINVAQYEAKYKQARIFLLLITIFSAANLLSVLFSETHFLFSSYVTQMMAVIGAEMYAETGEVSYVIVLSVISVTSLIPYLLCYIFSKKKHGWIITANGVDPN